MSVGVIMLFLLIISGRSFSCGSCFPFLLSSRAWNCPVPQRRRNKRLGIFFTDCSVFLCPEHVRFFFLPTLDVPVGKEELEFKITITKAFCCSCFWYFTKSKSIQDSLLVVNLPIFELLLPLKLHNKGANPLSSPHLYFNVYLYYTFSTH